MKNFGSAVAEVIFFLAPLSLAFFLLGAPGFKYAGLMVYPYQVAFICLIPISLIWRKPTWKQEILQTPGILPLVIALVFVVFSTVFYKQFPPLESRELKNVVFPLIAIFFLLTRYIKNIHDARRALSWIGIGIIGSLVFAYFRFGYQVFQVRAIRTNELLDVTGLSYIWFGVSGATLLAIGYIFLSRIKTSALAFIFFFGIGSLAVVYSGTRAALVAAVLFLVTLPFQKILTGRVLYPLIACGIGVVFFLSIFPKIMLEVLPPPNVFVAMQGPEGADRLTESSGYLQDLAARFLWWHLILYENSISSFFFGLDYNLALMRVGVLGHPHNIFVWAQVMGGFPASFMFCFALIRLIIQTHKISITEKDKDFVSLARASLFLYLILLLVFLTNSWAGGVYLLFGINLALTVTLSSHGGSETKRQKNFVF